MRKVITITRNCIISIIILFVSLAANVFSTVVNGSLDAFFSHISDFINLHSLAFYAGAFLLFIAIPLYINTKSFHKSFDICGFMKFKIANVKWNCYMIWSILGWICNCDSNSKIEQRADEIAATQSEFFGETNDKIVCLQQEVSTQTQNATEVKTNFIVKSKCIHAETKTTILMAKMQLDKSTAKFHLANKELYSLAANVCLEQDNPIDILIEKYQNIEQ